MTTLIFLMIIHYLLYHSKIRVTYTLPLTCSLIIYGLKDGAVAEAKSKGWN